MSAIPSRKQILFLIILPLTRCYCQTISSNMPLPPMEWIKLETTGTTSPPALSHGCLSGPTFVDSSGSNPTQAYLFGGRSAAGTTSNGIYILDYSSQSPSWSQPTTTTSTIFTSSPQSRSHLICGWDRASNFRNQLNIFGGRSEDGQPLNDFWFYDPANNFWAQPKQETPTNLPANYGGIGGMNPTFEPSPPSTSNAIMYVGGASSTHSSDNLVPSALSIDGQLGSNTNTIQANYSSLVSGLAGNASNSNIYNGRWGMTGTIMPDFKVVVFSGCNGDPSDEFKDTPDPSCSLLNGGILQFESGFSASKLETVTTTPTSSWTPFNYCPAPRLGGTMVPNRNRFDSSFAHQVIMIGGRIDSKNWNDQGGSQLGEVDVLDITSGVWSRVLPMRRNNATFTQKEGLLALALPSVIGSPGTPTTNNPTDILVYGGIDVSTGEASNELWILRLHAAKLTGNGTADGVTMSYLPSCVNPTPHNTHNNTKSNSSMGDTSDDLDAPEGSTKAPSGHFIFSSLALAMLMFALTILRCEEPGRLSMKKGWRDGRLWLVAGGWNILITSYGFLVLGIMIALFQSRDTNLTSLNKRNLFTGDSTYRKLRVQTTLSRSTHAKLGLVIGIVGLVLVPALYILSWLDSLLEDRRQKELSNGGPRRLKAKGSQGSGLKQRTFDRMVMLTQSFNRPKAEKRRSSMSDHHRLESLREKHSDLLVTQELSASSSRETSPRLPPIAVEVNSHERIGSTSTAGTNTQLLSKVGGFGIESNQHGQLISASLTQRPSQPQLKPLSSQPSERQLIRPPSSSLLKVFQNFSSSKKPLTPIRSSLPETEDGRLNNLSSSVSTSSAFEVLNRKPPSRQQRGFNGNRATRVSLDILSDSGSCQSVPSQAQRPNSGAECTTEDHGERKEGTAKDREYLQVPGRENFQGGFEEEEGDDDDDDDDSLYKKQIKARRKMRRLADMMLHSILLVSNIYLISACFVSLSRNLKWLGILHICFSLLCYAVMFAFAWNGKPSSESTLVIFISIIKDGSKSLMKNENLTGLGQFSSFRQQQQQAQQILAQGMVRSSVGGGMGENRSTTTGAGRMQGLSIYSASQHSATGAGSLLNSPEFFRGGGGGMMRSASPTETDFFSAGGSNHNMYPNSAGLFGGYPSHLLATGRREGSSSREAELFDNNVQNNNNNNNEMPLSEDHPHDYDHDQDHEFFDFNHNLNSPQNSSNLNRNSNLIGESYLANREIQIVTTAPKRKLAVVNG